RRQTLVFSGGAYTDVPEEFEGPSHAVDSESSVAIAFRTEHPVLRVEDGRSLLVVPMRAHRDMMGVLALADRRRPYDAADVLLGEGLARVAGPALANAQQYEHERLTGDLLQRGLLPRGVPELAGARLAARYVPGTVGLHVGGDWYDAVDVGDDGVILVIGDVV